jgi:hypothetical protein
MSGLTGLAAGTIPIAGGALLAMAGGQFNRSAKAPDFRASISADQDLLDRLPQAQTARRAELQRTIDVRIDELITATDRSRSLLQEASGYKGNWRDVVLVVCAVLFAVIWWDVPHSKAQWLPTFILLILLAVVTAVYAMRGFISSFRSALHRHGRSPRQTGR